MRVVKKEPSEIELLVKMSEKMTMDEMTEYIRSRFEKDFGVFKRLINEQKKRTDEIRDKPEIQPLLKRVRNLYEDLISDGCLKKDFDMFKRENLEHEKTSQARREVSTILNELVGHPEKDYRIVFRKMNRVYAINYETLIQTYLIQLAQRLSGKPMVDKAKVLEVLSKYKNGKYAEIFKSLIPQVRNSIQHTDYLIDPKKPQITFYDRKKPPLSFNIEEYSTILWEPWFLTIAFDIATFDIPLGFFQYLIEELDVVQNFLKEHNLKGSISDKAPLSLLDWATLIKSGKLK
jgi:archaellum component FlaC